ncbi:hypothetical protein [Streptomyces sp. H39-S7]|uniref:hypothetical protein n=1 Tax=Streptomyces sp. H39-S7 TaxID=3004357 RepID=UPI0022AF5A18|nr:hypothetical protein [Streptomyces sp. H39-S7]MCZ4120678.1 hypothetical protein [Streptomyces sp. H39-S7]
MSSTIGGRMSVPVHRDSRTEATRLLCAGVYLDAEFRGQVIEQLVQHEERPIAPSLGVDAVPVLAYALRARSQEVQTSLLLLFVWAVFLAVDLTAGGPVPGVPMVWSLSYAVLCMALWSSRAASGRGTAVYTLDRATLRRTMLGRRGRLTKLLPLGPRLLLAVYWIAALVVFFFFGAADWPAVVFPLLLVVPIWMHRAHVSGVMRNELARPRFAVLPRAQLSSGYAYRRIEAAIEREQHAGLTIYDPFRPFIGAGTPYEPWSFALELKRRKTAAPGEAQLTSRAVIELIRPRLEALRQSAAETSRDRLKDLEIEEFVYLPVGVPRGEVSYDRNTVMQHLADSVDEGGEARRHFLRIRVGAWDEQVVVSVLVRVHTQGGMLVLEVVPHILSPIRPEYRAVDVIAGRGSEDVFRDGVRALLAGPTAGFAAAVSSIRTLLTVFRTWLADPQRALPDGPATSVREMGSSREISLFQEMDISRYVKTIQDRIASGVRDALSSQGYETDSFEQQIVQVAEGGFYIGSMSGGAVAAGSGAQARHTTGGDQK